MRHGPIDRARLSGVMFQAMQENREGQEPGPSHPGFISIRTLAIASINPAAPATDSFFGTTLITEAGAERTSIGANPGDWMPIPVWMGSVGDLAGKDRFEREFIEVFLTKCPEEMRPLVCEQFELDKPPKQYPLRLSVPPHGEAEPRRPRPRGLRWNEPCEE